MGKTVAVDIGPHPTGNRPNIVDWTGFDGCDLPLDQQIANARLIAASPTMFDYVKRRADEGDAEAISIVENINAAR
jgi:hypothetical protein